MGTLHLLSIDVHNYHIIGRYIFLTFCVLVLIKNIMVLYRMSSVGTSKYFFLYRYQYLANVFIKEKNSVIWDISYCSSYHTHFSLC